MADGAKFLVIRKLLKALGLSDEAADNVIDWIEELLSGKSDKVAPKDLPFKLRDDFLSPAEQSFYLVIRNCVAGWADVCPKVNLGDVFFASCKSFGETQSYSNKINRKHVDFLLCDKITAKPLLGIELDDKSHNHQKRQERDVFVEQVFETAKLPLVRIPVQYSYNPTELNNRFLQATGRAMEELTASESIQVTSESAPTAPNCPKCSREMVLRTSNSGTNKGKQFWGCFNFPRCRMILPYDKA